MKIPKEVEHVEQLKSRYSPPPLVGDRVRADGIAMGAAAGHVELFAGEYVAVEGAHDVVH
jgi:hypothetical protein